ncbi:hypothetical protein OG401_30605 [Kitasatospora purpeofusca]|uniref:hypothetical protein n=1 Tax=Kitasatospora purpeofusca TaxID=67352 RepID=UPI002255D169|nr:hypothetical protein [Kitasatospora purpeofusca]MCX4688598.1 hypothetical protein [Kitasatospora purpeofusca]
MLASDPDFENELREATDERVRELASMAAKRFGSIFMSVSSVGSWSEHLDDPSSLAAVLDEINDFDRDRWEELEEFTEEALSCFDEVPTDDAYWPYSTCVLVNLAAAVMSAEEDLAGYLAEVIQEAGEFALRVDEFLSERRLCRSSKISFEELEQGFWKQAFHASGEKVIETSEKLASRYVHALGVALRPESSADYVVITDASVLLGPGWQPVGSGNESTFNGPGIHCKLVRAAPSTFLLGEHPETLDRFFREPACIFAWPDSLDILTAFLASEISGRAFVDVRDPEGVIYPLSQFLDYPVVTARFQGWGDS